ncbi:DUF4357 domain-containing protein [Phormidium tenue]|jgi:hypothetical protein|uniref:DUF4357 domain-containing protein n=1 Tax=Phormidium tenue FACHB-1050 TaxID=2692857 RepID=A0ABR8CCK8_9CYAN|nr:DUF4357 domain-containing protein [Phormidium tenue]MBD2318528.1 DUF4357 domain-containing protein [Phormidium tenue FACHB-1050]
MKYDKLKCDLKGITAFGYYKNQDRKEFVVLKGSFAVGDSELSPDFREAKKTRYKTYLKIRSDLIKAKKLEKKPDGDGYQFAEDVVFKSPSRAISIILGYNENGVDEFKPTGEKVDPEENIRSVNQTIVLKPDSIKTVETPVLAKQPFFKEEDDELAFSEGKKVERLHKLIERDKTVVDLAKKKAKLRDPFLCCSVCGFSFLKVYGEDFIEAHHTKPLSEITGETETKVEDLAIVCSNCHRMLHRRKPWRSISDLKSILNRK